MNTDRSSDVQAQVKAGAKVPWLAKIGWAGTAGGTLLLIAAGDLLVLGIRSRR